jgi:hypothetical protein
MIAQRLSAGDPDVHVALLFALSAATSPAADPATLAAIEATCHDYVDGQLEADPQRVARSLHRTWPSARSSAIRPTSAWACAGCRRKNWSR